MNSSATEYTNVSPIPVSLDFNEPMYSGVAASDLVVTNGQVNATAFDASGNPAFALEVTPAGEGAVTIRYPNRAGYDRAGNLNTGSNTLVRYYDITAPNSAGNTPLHFVRSRLSISRPPGGPAPVVCFFSPRGRAVETRLHRRRPTTALRSL